ncbi:MAG TPA: winged helix-turn-helix domain-containing protein [Terriglobales bacterium]|jgi:TolB-like protein/DNA-binding winged helix-turn-helix (wHTH) protein/Tfp pilus assembly protein PilF|nr:winged helix-turn-helix domain-containing protein [Terriglobales bacterium]
MGSTAQRRIARFGIYEADFDNRQLTKSGFRIRLQDKPFQLLMLLLERQGVVVTREELKEKLWPGDTFVEFDVGLNTAVKKLRAALNDSADNPRFVETVPRLGYRFVAPASVTRPESTSTVDPEIAIPAAEEPLESIVLAVAASDATPQLRFLSKDIEPASNRRLRLIAWAALAMVLLAAGFAIRARFKSAPSAAQSGSIQAIAVLPLENISADPSQEYLAEGMTDEIITDLAQLAGPKVISRTSAMQYKGTRKTIPEIARELHVGAVLEGSVERSGDRMRVRVQLIEAATDQHLWAEAYDRELSDVLLLEAELAQDIVRQIQVRLTPKQQDLTHNRPLNPQAFQDYLQGRHYWALRTSESLTTAIEYFNRAIQEDPNDARGYAGLAQCYIVLPMVAKTSQTEAYQKARGAAIKALALDGSLAEAHLSIAEVRLYQDWDFVGAENEFKKTLELNPNYSTGHQWYGEFLSLMARHHEAIRELQTALTLDPLSAIVHLQFGNTLQQARQYERALDEYQEALKIDPKFSLPFYAMHWAYRRQGKFAESIAPLRVAAQSWDAKDGWIALVDQLPAAYSSGGRTSYLRQCIKIHKRSERPWLYLARDYADLGDRAAALAELNKAYENRQLEVLYLLVDPELDPLRSDLRFQELVGKIGFPQTSGETPPISTPEQLIQPLH